MSELCWIDGYPFQGIVPDAPQPVTPNTELYWFDGMSAIDIFELVDTIPYNPPVVVYPTVGSYYGNETFWFDGMPSQYLKTSLFEHTGNQTFWVDGYSAEGIFEKDNNDTGKCSFLFEE
jgi:hypothetical protein